MQKTLASHHNPETLSQRQSKWSHRTP